MQPPSVSLTTHERVPYSVLRSALSRRNQALNSNRDQTNTKRALEHLDVLLTRYPYTTEAEEAEQIWRQMRTRLAEHEMGVGDFYMTHEEFQSAADRFRKVLNDFPGLGPRDVGSDDQEGVPAALEEDVLGFLGASHQIDRDT